MAKIETGVDRLVELINQQKRVTIEDAAKQLGVSKVVVQEWADFLEEEKIISIEYKFSRTYLVERKLSSDEVQEKQKEYSSQKDAFVRRVESSLRSLESDSLGLQNIKNEFAGLKDQIGGELDSVRGEVKKLEKYEYLKKNLDKEIEQQVADFHDILDNAHKEIDFEQKRYQELLSALEIEKRELQVKEHRLLSLEEKERELMKRIQNIYELSKELEKRIGTERTSISSNQKRVLELQRSVKEIESYMTAKKDTIQPLIDKAKKHEEHILKLQQDILDKVKMKTDEIQSKVQEGSKVVGNFEMFFERKAEIEQLISQLENEKKELAEEFTALQKKAIAFDLSSKSNTVNTQVKEVEGELNNLNQKRNNYKQDLEKLIKLIKG